MTVKEWFDNAPDGLKSWMRNVTFLRFLREQHIAMFQMPGRYDGAMSEQCKESFREQYNQLGGLLETITTLSGDDRCESTKNQ